MANGTLVGKIKGIATESFFEKTMRHFIGNSEESPRWIKRVQKASRGQDNVGIDFIVHTDVGRIFVQVKSSLQYANEYVQKHQRSRIRTCIIVIKDADTHVTVFRRTRSALSQQRQNVLRGFKKFIISAP